VNIRLQTTATFNTTKFKTFSVQLGTAHIIEIGIKHKSSSLFCSGSDCVDFRVQHRFLPECWLYSLNNKQHEISLAIVTNEGSGIRGNFIIRQLLISVTYGIPFIMRVRLPISLHCIARSHLQLARQNCPCHILLASAPPSDLPLLYLFQREICTAPGQKQKGRFQCGS